MTGLHAELRLVRDDFSLDVEVDVEAGETLALVGPNGAGKSTVVRLLAGLDPVDEGVITLDGELLDDSAAERFVPPARRRVGVVFQDHLLFEHLTVRANVEFGPRAVGLDRAATAKRVDHLLARFGVSELADRRADTLSGGQAQRAALARTLASDPRLLLLDEPLAALDVETKVDVRRAIGEHLETSETPTILITHDPVDALALADRIAVIEQGRITQVGTPDDVRQRPVSRYAASLVGTNLITGRAFGGVVVPDAASDHRLRIADERAAGPVRCAIRPEAISLHASQPTGSHRNVWETTIERLEVTGETARISVGDPLPLVADVTTAAVDALGLGPGAPVWLAVKATEISIEPV